MDGMKECEDDDAEKLFINESRMLFRRDFLRLYSAVVFPSASLPSSESSCKQKKEHNFVLITG